LRAFLATYTYFVGSFSLFVASLVVVGLCRTQRVTMLWSGLLATLWATAGFVIEGDYWQPQRIVGSFTGLEDVLFAFDAGVFTWLFATAVLRRRFVINLAIRTVVRWLIISNLLGISLFIVFRLFGIPLMASISCSMVGVGALLVSLRPQFWTMPLLGGFAYPVLHLVMASSVFWIWPQAITQWNLANLSGVLLLGVPVEEFEWAFGFGVMWPLLMAHVLDARLIRPKEVR
jgi:hypothetical protein